MFVGLIEGHPKCGDKYWDTDYFPKIKKIKYTLSLTGHEDVKFKLKGSCNKSNVCFEWATEAFKASSASSSTSDITTYDGNGAYADMRRSLVWL